MRRREFIAGLGGAAAAWPLAARAQQRAPPMIGFLDSGSPDPNSNVVTSFRRGLAESGFVEGRTAEIEFRWASNRLDALPRLAADLVARRAAVIVATGSPMSVHAARTATSTTPIVFAMDVDPVKYGLVASLNRPDGTMTGISFLTSQLAGKQLNLLLELIPQATTVAYLSGPSGAPIFEDLRSRTQRHRRSGARSLSLKLVVTSI